MQYRLVFCLRGATATGLMALGRHDDFTNAALTPGRRENARTEGKNFALATDAMILGGVAVAGVATWYYLKVYRPKVRAWDQKRRERAAAMGGVADGEAKPKLRVVPWVQPSGPGAAAGLALGGDL